MNDPNPMIAFECGKCYGHKDVRGLPVTCEACGGTGHVPITLDDLAERIARKVQIPLDPLDPDAFIPDAFIANI